MRLIDADALMREFAEFVRESNNSDFARAPTWNDAVSLVGSMPSAQPEQIGQGDCTGCNFQGWYDTDFPCINCVRKIKDYYVSAERRAE